MQFFTSLAIEIDITPDPVPSSKIVLSFRFSSRIASTSISVSGRGTRTSLVTKKSFFQNPLCPVKYARGSPLNLDLYILLIRS